MVGRSISHYQVLEKLGEGGMGAVYKASDTRLDRLVALKILLPDKVAEAERRRRFAQEAKAASALNHPNIVTIYDIDEAGGLHFIAMEYVAGRTLREAIGAAGLPAGEALDYAIELASALAAAHAAGIIHRDLKPANIMISGQGRVKVLDFGLAKLVEPGAGEDEATRTILAQTTAGAVVGTVSYMSPEQAEGKPLDARTDIFSFGAVLYEMLTGRQAFHGNSAASTLSAVLRDSPPPVEDVRRDVPAELNRILRRCLEKDRDERYPSAVELRNDLAACRERLAARRIGLRTLVRQPRLALPALVLLVALLAGGAWIAVRASRAHWARATALPEIARLIENENHDAAFRLVRQAEPYVAGEPEFERLKRECSLTANITTTPPGADVYWKNYPAVDAAWEWLGKSPVKGLRVPRRYLRWRITKEGFDPVEAAGFGSAPVRVELSAQGTAPPGMVRVAGGTFAFWLAPAAKLDEYWLDKYEVTNRQFKEFADRGGYDKREYWKHPFINGGKQIPWEEAMARFRDATGRPGPAAWELGAYPEGQGDYPVAGVSWYEAAAYAEFAGKSLPTIYHWYNAAGLSYYPDILQCSNFGGQGPVRVGSRQGISPYGACDMAGNVKEWCWNQTGGRRYILGGGWNEPSYMFSDYDAQSPFARSPTFGFRCAKYVGGPPAGQALAPIEALARDYTKEKPAADEIFRVYRSLYNYDHTDLKAAVEAVDDSAPYWRREKITFDAVYGGERMIAVLFLPRNAKPPYQTVICFPGSSAFLQKGSSNSIGGRAMDFIMRSGRALMYPVYKWSYERGGGVSRPTSANVWREFYIHASKDLGRSIDYLETRPDIDRAKLAYYGLSAGAFAGPLLTAVDGRFKAAVLVGGGLLLESMPPEGDPLHFAPRARAPVLMLNGRHDFTYPVEVSQLPLFRALGAPDKDKRHVLYDSGHAVPRTPMIKEVLAWLDRYLGPVRTR